MTETTTAYGLTVTRTGEYRTPNDYTGAVQELVTFHGNGRQEWVYVDRIVTSNVCQWFPIMVALTRAEVETYPVYSARGMSAGDAYEWGAETTFNRAEGIADELGGWVGTPYAMHENGEECDCY